MEAVSARAAPALCVPVGWSRVRARDNVPHLSDGDGNPYGYDAGLFMPGTRGLLFATQLVSLFLLLLSGKG